MGRINELLSKRVINEDAVSFTKIVSKDTKLTEDLLDDMVEGFMSEQNTVNKIMRSIMFGFVGSVSDKFEKSGKAKTKSSVSFEVFVNEKYSKDKKEITFKVIS